jgi:hypothetical protein
VLPPRYDIQQAIDAERFRGQERHFSHVRALKMDMPRVGFASRLAGRLASFAAVFRPTDPMREKAAKVCRLADGSMGRVAMRKAGWKWIEVCVRVSESSALGGKPTAEELT